MRSADKAPHPVAALLLRLLFVLPIRDQRRLLGGERRRGPPGDDEVDRERDELLLEKGLHERIIGVAQNAHAACPRFPHQETMQSITQVRILPRGQIINVAERTQFQLFVVRHMPSRIRAAQRSRSARLRLENARRS